MAGLEERGSVPVPDPTKLTTESVAAAKIELEKLFDTKIETIKSDIANFRLLVDEKFTGRQTALDAALKSANELVKQQNESNALAAEKAEKAENKYKPSEHITNEKFTAEINGKQCEGVMVKFDDRSIYLCQDFTIS